MSPINIARVYFDRKPPYATEIAMRIAGEQVRVSYELKVERDKDSYKASYLVDKAQEVKRLSEEYEKKEKEMNKEMKKEVKQEKILEAVVKLNELYPNFSKMSEREQTLIIADIINGKYDDTLSINEKEASNEHTSDTTNTEFKTDIYPREESGTGTSQQEIGRGFSATA